MAEKVRWTKDEVDAVVRRFVQLRMKDLIGPTLAMLKTAQDVLPQDRRRDPPTLANYGRLVEESLLDAAKGTAKYFEPANAACAAPIEKPKVELFGQTLRMPLGGSLVEIPFPMLDEDFQLLIDTVWLWRKKLTPFLKVADTSPQKVVLPEESPRPIFQVTKVAVKEPPQEDREIGDRGRIFIFGMMAPHVGLLKPELEKFKHLAIQFVADDERDVKRFEIDHAVLTTGNVRHIHADFMRRKFMGKQSRLHWVSGIVDARKKLHELDLLYS